MGAARLTLALLLCAAAGCADAPHSFILGASTSVSDSGLLDSLIAEYRRAYPDRRIRAVSAPDGRLLEWARRGAADLVIVQAPSAEDRFVREVAGAERTPLMYNDLLIVGPVEDPAGVAGSGEPAGALARIRESGAAFVSLGDGSGIHERELALWRESGGPPPVDGYVRADAAQGATLRLASARRAYALTDRATFASLRHALELEPLVQGHASLANLYSIILPGGTIRAGPAGEFARWLTSVTGRRVIAGFRHETAGSRLFAPLVLGRSLPFPGGAGGEEPAQDTAGEEVTTTPG